MLQDLLWLYGVKRQYEIQKEAGLAGLIALVSTFIILWQWDNLFYPFLEAIGLVHLINVSGLMGGTIRETIINVSVTFLFFVFALGLAIALPMLLLMILFSFVNSNSERPNPIVFVVGLVFLPIMLIIYCIYRVLLAAGLIKRSRPQTVQEYAREKSVAKKGSIKLKQPVEQQYLELLTIQESRQGHPTSYVEVTLEIAQKVLNRAIPSLELNNEYLFGFDEKYNTWYILLPNPIPIFASEAVIDTRPEITPFNFEKLSKAQIGYTTNAYASKPLFYVPALPIKFDFDSTKQIISMSSWVNHNGFIACVDSLSKIVKINGAVAKQVYEEVTKKVGIQALVKKAHAYAYTIPLAYPIEVQYFNDSSCPFSYYKALQSVPNATELCEFYKEEVLRTVRHKSASGHLWARDLVNQLKEKEEKYIKSNLRN